MIISRTQNTLKGTLWGTIYRIVATIFPFIIRTIIIKEFGEDYLGLNSLFTSILQVLNLSELGLSNAIIYSMYKPIANDDYKTLGGLMRLYRKLYLFIGSFILVVGLSCLPFLNYLINGSYPADINIYFLYIIFLFNSSVSYLLFGYKEALLAAYQRNDVLNKIRLVTFFGQFLIQIFVLLFLRDYYIYALIMAIATISRSLLNYKSTVKLFPNIGENGSVDKSIIKEIKTNVLGISIGKACTISRGASNSIVISAFVSLSALAIFDNYFYIISAITAFLTIIETSLVAGVGNSIVTESKVKNYIDFKKINFIFMWIVGSAGICCFCLYQSFMEIWVGKSLMLSDTAAALFSIYFVISCFSSIPSVYCTAAGLWWRLKYKSITEVVANIFLNIIFVYFWGIIGILIATITTLFLINFCWGSYVLYKNYFTDEKLLDIVLLQLKYFIVILLVGSITYRFCKLVVFSNYYCELAVSLVISVILPQILFFVVYRKDINFPALKSVVLKIKK